MTKPAIDPNRLESLIYNADRAAEIAFQLKALQELGDEAWGELVTYAIDQAHAEARKVRDYFQSCAPRIADAA